MFVTDELYNAFASNIKPPEELTVDQWADKYRILPEESSSESGPWRTSRFPFLREIMWELSPDSPTKEIVVMKGAQLGFTEIGINWIGHTIDVNPTPFLYVQKTIEAVAKFSTQRLTPSILACPTLKEKIAPEKSRNSTNTIRLKTFPGGILILGGANSASSLRSMPIGYLMLDEEESYDADIEEEGNPSDIAIRRTANFPNRKIFRISTPAIKETSVIEPLFLSGDRRYFYLPCPFCGFEQVLISSKIVWDDGDPTSVRCVCENCTKGIEEYHKTAMLDAGVWMKLMPGKRRASFHLNSFYSPIGFYGWQDFAEAWEDYLDTRDRGKLKVIVNTVFGETFSEAQAKIEYRGLAKRREEYAAEVPREALVLTSAYDVQVDRLEAEVVGWGLDGHSWSIDYFTIMGDPKNEFTWKLVEDQLNKTYEHESGVKLTPSITMIDSGYLSDIVYGFCKKNVHRRVFPLKGRYGWGMGAYKRPRKTNEHGVYLFIAYTDELKAEFYARLRVTDPAEEGYCHFPILPQYDVSYFAGLTAEKLVEKKTTARKRLEWQLMANRRNEPLDLRVYNTCGLHILNPNLEMLAVKGPMSGTGRMVRRRRAKVHSKGV